MQLIVKTGIAIIMGIIGGAISAFIISKLDTQEDKNESEKST